MPFPKIDLNISIICKIINIETSTRGTKTTSKGTIKIKQQTQDLSFREVAKLDSYA